MRFTLLAASLLALAATGPALAQVQTGADAEADIQVAPIPGVVVETEQDLGVVLGTGALPGVGIGTTSTTETNAPNGPGGLSGGVGATGTMAPATTGAAGSTGGVPGTGTLPEGVGIPLGTNPQ